MSRGTISTAAGPATDGAVDWYELNGRYLQAALRRVRGAIERFAAEPGEPAVEGDAAADELLAAFPADAPPAHRVLCETFDLSPFEADVLILAAGPELDPAFGARCAAALGGAAHPTFGLAMAALPEAHWSALQPSRPLRHWRLIEIGPGPALCNRPLHVEERVLHFLHGVDTPDERLAGVVEPIATSGGLVPSHRRLAERLATTWAEARGRLPVVQLCGADRPSKRAVAAAACEALGLGLHALPAAALPAALGELDAFLRLLGREAALSPRALLLDCDAVEGAGAGRDGDRAAAGRVTPDRTIAAFAGGYRGALLVSSRERRRLDRCLTVPVEVARPEAGEQATLWQAVLGEAAASLNGQVETLTAHFDLDADAIRAAGAEALGAAASAGEAAALGKALWQACLGHARPSLDALAQRLPPAAGWDELVLPEAQGEMLRDVAVHVRQRRRVYGEWGFAERSPRGLGISVLFAGPSGTGKTMAAEVLARELELDLYRIDLAAVVSKYIGETEKNLRRVFDAAESGGAILLFDEADALFGKRSEVRDSHDRYANIEVSYLLQRIEAFRGLAILTTNLKTAIDPAFLRRIRFVVQFPFPDAELRAEIWRRIFPPETPTAGLDPRRLARLSIAGGNIRNIALGAAFLAAAGDRPVDMGHVLRAARAEYAKLERPLTAEEVGDWAR